MWGLVFSEVMFKSKKSQFLNEDAKLKWFNPLPHIGAFGCLCSRRLFENIVTKEEIAPLLVIGYPFNYKYFLFFDKMCSKSSAAELSYEGKD